MIEIISVLSYSNKDYAQVFTIMLTFQMTYALAVWNLLPSEFKLNTDSLEKSGFPWAFMRRWLSKSLWTITQLTDDLINQEAELLA